MADSLISALVKDLVGRLTSEAIQEYGLLRGLKKDLSDLNKTFKKIQRVLYDAEEKQKTQKDVEEWLRDLKSASLEAENVIDEAKTEAMIRRLHREMGKKYRLRAFFSSRYNPVMVKFRIAHKVKDIKKKLQGIDAEISKLQLISNTRSEDGAGIGSNWKTSSLMPEIDICGRDKEKMMIVDKICNHDDDGVRVYAIWGMGGMGKTTLAQLLYNDETVKTHFDLKCWVYVSAVFDVTRIIKAICGSEVSELESMQACLQEKLRGKKFFIVMDDVWIENKDMVNWGELYKGLSCGAKGSTVLVTTRKKDTALRMAKNIQLHNVEKLTDDESWSLFKKLALPGRGEGENVSKELVDVGMEIVKKCNGLPLAVKSLGSLMWTKEEKVDEWRAVNENFKWEKDDDIVLSALKLSYDDLPPHMKICFAYCCLFLKGEEMSKDSLIELWMVNGFIPSQGYASLYEDGKKIFDCLVRRSFFQDVVEKDIRTGVICKMHDLMHDLARNVMKHDFAVIEPGKESITQDEVLHLSLSGKDFKFSEENLEKLRSVRSMFVYNIDYTSNNITQIFNHVYLRVLYLNKIESSTLPESICKLIHLRYLKISHSWIKVLPESIIYLQNLQTLILEECSRLRELPKGLRYMRNLQRLDMGGYNQLQHMPVGIKELTNLRRLSQFAVGRDKGARIGELGNMNLVGKLKLSRLENVGGLREAESANLKDKTNLKSLEWSWGRSEETNDSEVVEGLEPNSGLQELTILRYMGRVISPSWLVKLVNLTSIIFWHLEKCEQLPPLGKLHCLKRIQLYGMNSLKCFHDEDNAPSKDEILFPSLQQLDICLCDDLVSLPNNFPKLQSLKIEWCEKLGSLPDEIRSFKDLNQITIIGCEILSRRCEKDNEDLWPKISHIPHLDIRPPQWWPEVSGTGRG